MSKRMTLLQTRSRVIALRLLLWRIFLNIGIEQGGGAFA